MTRRYERECWNCHSRNMVNRGDYVLCQKCGATWRYIPKLAEYPITMRRDLGLGEYKSNRVLSPSPSLRQRKPR
jgi:hypothetical protein